MLQIPGTTSHPAHPHTAPSESPEGQARRSASHPPVRPEELATATRPQVATPSIVIVDDNPLDAELLLDVLHELLPQAHVKVLPDPAEALEYLAVQALHGAQPDVVLLDINMPRLNGFEVLTRLRAQPHTRPMNVVLFSTSADEGDIRLGTELGASGYLVKPLTLEKLRSVMRTVVTRWT